MFSAIGTNTTGGALCATDLDCSNNGMCAGGTCSCDAAWMGPACTRLNLLPATRGTGLHSPDAHVHNTSSWGGSVLKGDSDGKYHMWASELINNCGLNLWTSNSHIVHAIADAPNAAYTVVGEAHGVFSHEPNLVRGPGKEYIMVRNLCRAF